MNDEKQLIDRARRGDIRAYEEIVRRSQGEVRTFVKSRILNDAAADDIAQEVFVGAYKSIVKFQGNSSLKSWLFSIAKNKIVDFIRKESRRQEFMSELQSAFATNKTQHSPLQTKAQSDLPQVIESLKQCVSRLSPDAKQMIKNFYYEDISAAKIAQSTGHKAGSVRMMLMRIRRALAKCIDANTEAHEQ